MEEAPVHTAPAKKRRRGGEPLTAPSGSHPPQGIPAPQPPAGAPETSRQLSLEDLFGSEDVECLSGLCGLTASLLPSRSATADVGCADNVPPPHTPEQPPPPKTPTLENTAVKVSNGRQDEFLIKEGSHHGDFLQFFLSGETFHSAYTVRHKIGEGGFGKVFLATHNVLGVARAVKRLSKADGRKEARKNELAAVLSLDHPHIVKLVEYYDEEQYLYLVFELCEGPDLFDRIVTAPDGRLNEVEASIALRHMLKALQCCHSQYRGHYDIKPENFMYASEDLSELMMIDLGLSSGFDAHRKRKLRGTEAYMAPECRRGIYGPEADVWSCGVVLFVMLTGQPFLPMVPGSQMKLEVEVRHLIKRRIAYAAKVFRFSPEAKELLSAMLQHDRHARPTVREALNHPFSVNSYSSEGLDRRRMQRPAYQQALSIRDSWVATARMVAKEPMLKRVARLAIAHAVGASEAERLAFRMLDRHGYGELSIGVLEEELESRNVPVPDDLPALFKAMDLARDGYINYMTFLSMNLPRSSLEDEIVCRIAFRMLDIDKDWYISAVDLATVFGHPFGSQVCQRSLDEVSFEGRVSWENFLDLMSAGIDD